MKRAWGISFVIAAAVALLGCSDNSCYDNGNALPLAQFRTSGSTSKVSVSPVTVHGIGAPGDSLLLESATTSEFSLPLRATTTITQYHIALGDEADTLTLRYEPIPRFVGAECGAMYYFRLKEVAVTTNVLDSVVIAIDDSLVTNVSRVALYLYLTE